MQNVISELIVDAYDCAGDLNDPEFLEHLCREAAKSVGATVATSVYHQFQPHGLTLCLVLMESHLVVSTWPEHRLAIVNIFLCNPGMDAKVAWEHIANGLQAGHYTFHTVKHVIEPLKKAA